MDTKCLCCLEPGYDCLGGGVAYVIRSRTFNSVCSLFCIRAWKNDVHAVYSTGESWVEKMTWDWTYIPYKMLIGHKAQWKFAST